MGIILLCCFYMHWTIGHTSSEVKIWSKIDVPLPLGGAITCFSVLLSYKADEINTHSQSAKMINITNDLIDRKKIKRISFFYL